jgi:ATPase subunit of ABC transporter with duplicated ATPase domains
MSMLSAAHLSVIYGARLLFEGVNLNFLKGERYAVVGGNGVGKSTLLRILSGVEEPSFGEVTLANRATLGFLSQDHFRYEHDRILDVVIQGRAILWNALQEQKKLLDDGVWTLETGGRLGELEEIIAHQDGYTAEGFAEKLLLGLGIAAEDIQKPLSSLSGGYKLRVLLAQALFNRPDVLLLDEPTNHLDILSIAWLEAYLKSEFRGVLIFISHDQNFLENLSTQIVDVDYGDVRLYPTSYKKFLADKQLYADQKASERKSLEKRIEQMQGFVDRFRAKASKARQAQSRVKQIERIELPDIEHSSRVSPTFKFSQTRPPGKVVLTVHEATKYFGPKRVLNKVSLTVQRGERVALIGPNGIGKSTFLKAALDLVPLTQGTTEWGHEVALSYFAQDHHELLEGNVSILTWLTKQAEKEPLATIRGTLGAVLFRQDEVDKSISVLSGGESARLLLGKMMLERGNVLLLDEPTNHLDLEATQALAKALKAYDGTILFVSHDRHFVSKLATRIVAITDKGVTDYHGTYRDYLEKHSTDYLSQDRPSRAPKTSPGKTAPPPKKKNKK